MKTVGERIRQAREFRGLSGEELALQVGYKTQSGISNLENRPTGRGGFMLRKIAERLGFAVEWFTDGPDVDDMRDAPPYKPLSGGLHHLAKDDDGWQRYAAAASPPAGALPVSNRTQHPVWVVGKGQGGMPERIWSDGDYPVGHTDEFSEVHTTDPEAFLVQVEGNSMYPKYEHGNYALVEPSTEPELEEVVLVRLETGETMLKRLLSRRNGYRLGSYSTPEVLEYAKGDVTWMYYVAHEVPRRKIKGRH